MKILSSLIFTVIISNASPAQKIYVVLDSLSSVDDYGMHVEILLDRAVEEVILPEFESSEMQFAMKFLNIFYSRDVNNDENISILVLQFENEDLLFVDKNNDEDLTNDGEPFIFPIDQNEITFEITPQQDVSQVTKFQLCRIPRLPDSLILSYVDEKGNLRNHAAKIFGAANGIPNFNGENRSFFFDYRISLRWGTAAIDAEIYKIGLFDYSNNGIYYDTNDVVIIDLDRNNMLEFYSGSEVFDLDDVVKIGGSNYEIVDADKYGKYLYLEKTGKQSTGKFLRRINRANTGSTEKTQSKFPIDNTFWEMSFEDIYENVIELKELKNKNVLLNFWGEWCSPCIAEIPELVDSYNLFKNKLELVSFIKLSNLDKAKSIIEQKSMLWNHILLTPEIEKKFQIVAYPTNILILRGKSYSVRMNRITKEIIESHLQ